MKLLSITVVEAGWWEGKANAISVWPTLGEPQDHAKETVAHYDAVPHVNRIEGGRRRVDLPDALLVVTVDT